MKKSTFVLCAALIILSVTFIGCDFAYSETANAYLTQCTYAIPGGYYYPDAVSGSKDIECDEYGRVLLQIRYNSIYALAVRQKIQQGSVYYYDNVSFKLFKDFESYTQTDVQKLKAENDWNAPLNETKMISRPLNDSQSLLPYYNVSNQKYFNTAGEFFAEEMNLDSTKKVRAVFSDTDRIEQELYYVEVTDAPDEKKDTEPFSSFFAGRSGRMVRFKKTNDTDDMQKELYLMMIDPDGTFDPDERIVKIDDIYNINECLIKIKEQNGWEG